MILLWGRPLLAAKEKRQLKAVGVLRGFAALRFCRHQQTQDKGGKEPPSAPLHSLAQVLRAFDTATFYLSITTRNLSITTRNLSIATRNLSIATRNLSVATRNLSVITRNLSVITRNLSIATRNLSVELNHQLV